MSLTEPWTKPTANYRPLSSCHLPDDRWSRRDNEGIEAKPQRLFSKTTFDDIIVRRPLAPGTRLASNAGLKLRLTQRRKT